MLTLIVAIGILLRFWSLGSTELIHDEGLDMFRSVGYLDYLDSAAQSTPVQWFTNTSLPWWTSLSFHDGPPLFFAIQYIFFSVFGESLLVARLPSALSGVGSIILIFAVIRRSLRSDVAALIGAGVLSVNFAHIWISRIAILESLVIFFALLNIYFFLRFIDDRRKWIWFGATLGLVFLIKYTAIFLIPVYAAYLVSFRRDVLSGRHLYYALLIAVILLSPVIVYNIGLFYSFGHFDLQIASLLHQQMPQWQGASGKTQEPFSNIVENLLSLYSIPLLLLIFFGVISALCIRYFVSASQQVLRPMRLFVFGLFVSTTLMLVFVGSAIRFTALFAVPGAMAIAMLVFIFLELYRQMPRQWIKISGIVLFATFFLYESYFAISTARFIYAADFGVLALDRYFDEQFSDARPPGLPQHPNPHLDAVIQKYAKNIPNTLPPAGIIYDENTGLAHSLWLFSRRQFYHGIPIMPASEFEMILQKNGFAAFSGFTLYVVRADQGAPLTHGARTRSAEHIEQLLREKLRLSPDRTITDDQGAAAFRVYKFSI